MAGSEKTVAFTKAKLFLSATRQKVLKALVRQLDDDEYQKREMGQKALRQAGRDAEPALRKALTGNPGLEQKRRIARLLKPLDHPKEWARRGRVLDLLERIGTKEACAVLKKLAKESPTGWFGVEAREALERIARRAVKD